MLDRLLGRRSSATAPSATMPDPHAPASPPKTGSSPSDRMSMFPPKSSGPLPYEVPCPAGTCHLLRLPDEILARIFTQLDRTSLTRCLSLCKPLNELLCTNSAIALHHLLMCNSLMVNPNALRPNAKFTQAPPSSALLLNTLRERLTRFRNLTPKDRHMLEFSEPEGRLYEYLEGTLLRGVGGSRLLPHELAVYDLDKLGEWEDVPTPTTGSASSPLPTGRGRAATEEVEEVDESNEIQGEVRRTKRFNFEIAEFAVDPGSDLLVLVEIRTRSSVPRTYSMDFHLLTLSTFEPHPRAEHPILTWPMPLGRHRVSLGFQICDDGLFVLHHNNPRGPHDQLCGWQWTTGRLAVTLRANPTMSFENFVLLTPSSFVIPVIITHLDAAQDIGDELDNPADLSWTHHLHIYAFPPLATTPLNPGDPHPPPHTAVSVAILDLPVFHIDIFANIPPPRLSIRTDPPPRHTFPSHPEHAPPAFAPEPESGIIIMEVHCQVPLDEPDERDPHFVIALLKKTLIQYLPAPTSPLLRSAFPRPAPVIEWRRFAPSVRMFGPDMLPSSWVCYVYGNRYVIPARATPSDREPSLLQLYDFDPLRVRKELCDRTNQSASTTRSNQSLDEDAHPYDGDRDGIELVTSETVIEQCEPLTGAIITGSKLPYMMVTRPNNADVLLIDGERIISVQGESTLTSRLKARAEVLEF